MDLKKQNVLFFLRAMQHGGTENVVLQLCEILKPYVNKIVVCSADGLHISVLSELKIKHYKIPDIEKKSPVTVITVSEILKRIVKQEKITIIHTHHRMAAFYISILGLYRKCTFINTSHNTFKNKKFLTKYSYKHGHLIACGEMVKKNLVDYFELPQERVTVIHNAVKSFHGDIVKDNLIEKLHNQGYFIVGNIGRLSKQKGMEYFINAIPDIIKQQPKTRFVIVGSGEEEQKLKELVKELKICEYVIFLGYRNDIQNLMSQLDLIVLTSLWEGLPLTPIEAFSVGKTIVATDVDGTREIVQDGVNGLLIEVKNNKQLVNSVVKLCINKELYKQLEVAAYQTYRRKFAYGIFSKKYITYYENINRSDE